MDPVAEHEQLATALAALVGMVKMPEHDRVEAPVEVRERDLVPQPVGFQGALALRVA